VDRESFVLARLRKNGFEVIFEKDAKFSQNAASLAKVFLAAELLRLIDERRIQNKVVEISRQDLDGTGTDVLIDLVNGRNKIVIDALTLMGLMIKYSCNSSALILAKKFLPKREVLQSNAIKFWGLKDARLVDNKGQLVNYFSLLDFLILFQKIYNKSGQNWDLLREKLKESRNIYYLFDQLELEVLGSKTGTLKVDNWYWVDNCGVINFRGERYFLGAMVSRRRISKAVKRIRKIGRDMLGVIKLRGEI
jgi:hypothetical protein